MYTTFIMMCREFHSWVYDVDWKPRDLHVFYLGGWMGVTAGYLPHCNDRSSSTPVIPRFKYGDFQELPSRNTHINGLGTLGWNDPSNNAETTWINLWHHIPNSPQPVDGKMPLLPERLWKSVHYKLAPAMHSQFLMLTPRGRCIRPSHRMLWRGNSFLSTSHQCRQFCYGAWDQELWQLRSSKIERSR